MMAAFSRVSVLAACLLVAVLAGSCTEEDFTGQTAPPPQPPLPPADTTIVNPDNPSADSAYATVAEAQAMYNRGESQMLVIRAYIVGAINGNTISGAYFKPPFTTASNLLLADSPETTDTKDCMPLMLTSGSKIRRELNLADNPQLWHRQLIIYAIPEAYFRVCGIRKASYYQLVDDVE